MRILDKITRTRRLPKGFTLEYISRFEPNDHTQFDAWSVRLRVPGGTIQNGTTCITIENRMIRSQTAGPREREVIEKWRKRNEGRPIGFGSPDEGEQRQFKQYIQERENAAKLDRAEQK